MQRTGLNRRRIIFHIVAITLIVGLILLDQLLKRYFKNNYSAGEEKFVIDGFFYFTYTFNTGAAFSFLANKSWSQLFFKILTGVALVLFVLLYIYSAKRKYKWLSITIVFVLSGAIGNFIDRLMYDGVVDFIGFIFFGWHFPVFNIADICMCVGVIMVIIHFLFLDKNALFRKNGKKNLPDNK